MKDYQIITVLTQGGGKIPTKRAKGEKEMQVTDVYIEVDFERRTIATVDVNGRAWQGVRCEATMYADGKPALMAIAFEIPQDSGEGGNKSA